MVGGGVRVLQRAGVMMKIAHRGWGGGDRKSVVENRHPRVPCVNPVAGSTLPATRTTAIARVAATATQPDPGLAELTNRRPHPPAAANHGCHA